MDVPKGKAPARNALLLLECQRAAHLGIWEWRLRESHVSWSEELYQIYGVTTEEYSPTFEGYLAKVHPDDRERVRLSMEKVFRERTTFSHDERILRPSGEIRHLHTWGHAVLDEAENLVGLIGVCQDITDQVLAREALNTEKSRFQLLASISRTLASSLDYDATLENVARLVVPELADWCSLFRLEDDGSVIPVATSNTDPAMARLVLKYQRRFAPDPGEFYRARTVIASGQSTLIPEITDQDLRAIARDPEQLELLRKLQPKSRMLVPLAARGNLLGAIALNYSTSDRRYTNQDLELAEEVACRAAIAIDNARLYRDAQSATEVRDSLLETGSGELRGSLAEMKNGLQRLSEWLGSDTLRGVPGLGNAEADHRSTVQLRSKLDRQLDELQGISRLSAGAIKITRVEVDLLELVREVIEKCQELGAAARCPLEARLIPGLLGWWDRDHLRQALVNLLNIAISHGTGKPIQIQLLAEGGRAIVMIRGTSSGQRAEPRKKLLGRFAGTRSLRDSRDLGLGLLIAWQNIGAHEGSIAVETYDDDEMAFKVELPFA